MIRVLVSPVGRRPPVRDRPGYEGFARRVAGAVRAADPTRPLIENDWVEPDPGWVFTTPVLTAHWYGRLHAAWLAELDAKARRWTGLGRPLFVTEFGDWGLPSWPATSATRATPAGRVQLPDPGGPRPLRGPPPPHRRRPPGRHQHLPAPGRRRPTWGRPRAPRRHPGDCRQPAPRRHLGAVGSPAHLTGHWEAVDSPAHPTGPWGSLPHRGTRQRRVGLGHAPGGSGGAPGRVG
jgi:hypothetical protein